MPRNKSKVHPKYKTKYRVGNWAAYDRSLVDRGSITLWLSPAAIAAWTPAPTGRRGGPRKFSDAPTCVKGSLDTKSGTGRVVRDGDPPSPSPQEPAKPLDIKLLAVGLCALGPP